MVKSCQITVKAAYNDIGYNDNPLITTYLSSPVSLWGKSPQNPSLITTQKPLIVSYFQEEKAAYKAVFEKSKFNIRQKPIKSFAYNDSVFTEWLTHILTTFFHWYLKWLHFDHIFFSPKWVWRIKWPHFDNIFLSPKWAWIIKWPHFDHIFPIPQMSLKISHWDLCITKSWL